MNANISQVHTSVSLPAIDMPYVIGESFYICGKHFVYTGLVHHNFDHGHQECSLLKLPFVIPDH